MFPSCVNRLLYSSPQSIGWWTCNIFLSEASLSVSAKFPSPFDLIHIGLLLFGLSLTTTPLSHSLNHDVEPVRMA